MREIKDSDWKLVRKLHSVALERFCGETLLEINRIDAKVTGSNHQKYLEIYGLIRRRDREIARVFNDLRRSTALRCVVEMANRGLLTKEECSAFSKEMHSHISG